MRSSPPMKPYRSTQAPLKQKQTSVAATSSRAAASQALRSTQADRPGQAAVKLATLKPRRARDQIDILGKRPPAGYTQRLGVEGQRRARLRLAREVQIYARPDRAFHTPVSPSPAERIAQRLQKVLVQSGLGSRREMDRWIQSGRVAVNQQIAIPGLCVRPGDRVQVDGKFVRLRFPNQTPRLLIYHKAEGELVSRYDPQGRVTVFDRLARAQGSFWTVIGRLDYNTSGLLLFTTSGELADRLTHPRFAVEREYAVRLFGTLSEEQRHTLVTGVPLADGKAVFERIEEGGGEGHNRWYRVWLKEGRNRQIRRMFAYLGLKVNRLIRTRFGPIALPPRLKRGTWTEMPAAQVVAVLKELVLASTTGKVTGLEPPPRARQRFEKPVTGRLHSQR